MTKVAEVAEVLELAEVVEVAERVIEETLPMSDPITFMEVTITEKCPVEKNEC